MKQGRLKFRKLCLAFHRYLALFFGVIFVLLGTTGSLLVFYVEIDQWLNPQLAVSHHNMPRQSKEAVFGALQSAHPLLNGPWRLEMPLTEGRPLMARYYPPGERHHTTAPLMISVNPHNLEISSTRVWGDFAMTWIYDLHFNLLLNEFGIMLIGILGLVMTCSLLSGIYLWWPAQKKFRGALTARRYTSTVRRTYDLHKLGGIYSLPILLVVALSGFAMNLPEWANPVIDSFTPISAKPKVFSVPTTVQRRTDVDQAVAVAQAIFPEAEVRWIETPDSASGAYLVRMYQTGEPSRRFPRTYVWVDQYSGAVLAQRDSRQRTTGDSIIAWLHPLHNGEAFGLIGRLVILVTGLILPLLFVTGIMRWRQKVQSRKRIRQNLKNKGDATEWH